MENREDAYPLGDITPVTPVTPVTPDLIRGPCVGFCAGRKAKRGWIPGQARDDGRVVKDDGWVVKDDGWVVKDDGWVVKDDGRVVKDDGWVVKDDGWVVKDDGRVVKDDGWLSPGDGWLGRRKGVPKCPFRGQGRCQLQQLAADGVGQCQTFGMQPQPL